MLDISRRAQLCKAAVSSLQRLLPLHFRETEDINYLIEEVVPVLAEFMALMVEVVTVPGGGHHVLGGGGI